MSLRAIAKLPTSCCLLDAIVLLPNPWQGGGAGSPRNAIFNLYIFHVSQTLNQKHRARSIRSDPQLGDAAPPGGGDRAQAPDRRSGNGRVRLGADTPLEHSLQGNYRSNRICFLLLN